MSKHGAEYGYYFCFFSFVFLHVFRKSARFNVSGGRICGLGTRLGRACGRWPGERAGIDGACDTLRWALRWNISDEESNEECNRSILDDNADNPGAIESDVHVYERGRLARFGFVPT